MRYLIGLANILACITLAQAADANRLTYLDEMNPYYGNRDFARLTTPQWVGEEGVEAVVILAIDDMRDHKKYENYLRPILNRLKKIDGRAPVSIMTNRIDPKEPHLQRWLKEGLSLETHTYDHPCPLLKGGDFARARTTYDRCIDLLADVPKSSPVAFRMPCCDSLNTPSPRFYAEIFNQTTTKKNHLAIDTSVFNIFTSNDPALPRELVIDANGRDRFRKYVPYDRSFVNTIEDYPYPYVMGRLCWQFPCVVPSDWEAQHLHKPNNPITVRDWKAALDATVIKRGVFCLVFHPHGWIKAEQVIELIDHAVARHGKKVKFLNFREAYDRVNKHLLAGQPIRRSDGGDNGVRVLDLNRDGFMDVVIGNDQLKQTRLWSPEERSWIDSGFPTSISNGLRFGVLRDSGFASCLVRSGTASAGWHFDGKQWVKDAKLVNGIEVDTIRNQAVRLRDVNHDGKCEFLVANERHQGVFEWSAKEKTWKKLPFNLPAAIRFDGHEGKTNTDNGLRFADINEDGFDDVIFSNEKAFGLYLFKDMKTGWSRKVLAGKPGDQNALPLMSRNGTNNGPWFHSRHLWVQNENTNLLPNLVDRRSFNVLLRQVQPQAKSPQASLKCIQPRPGFAVELAAAEPLVEDPVCFAWGPDGKLWVVEMGDYPLGAGAKGKPGGRVKFLEDKDGDGKYDQATLFLGNLSYPTGIAPWRKGVLITCAPDILYAEDTNGDGKADKKEVLYTGFGQGNQQHRVNSLCWGLDNWIYCANGDSGGRVKSMKTGKVVDIRGRDFRIRPDTGEIDLQMGQTQFGRSRDDWGNWFGCNNSNPMWHFALNDGYLRRNPHLRYPEGRVQISVNPGPAQIYPISRALPRFNNPQSVNHFTSACSPIVYRDALFGPRFRNNTFVCEPVHNLVHREVMSPTGATFTSKRDLTEASSEFLASSDNWFRPVYCATGPDGSLWVADMYRHVIEHPEWIPKQWQMKLDLRAGHERGRIYRVFPVGSKRRPMPRLDKLTTAELVAALDSPNGWQRDLAQQMLLWRNDKSAVPHLKKLALRCDDPLGRQHALCTLDGLQALDADLLGQSLSDKHPGVRRHAIRLCEPLLAKHPELGKAVAKLIDDADPQVRMQLAYTLGEWQSAQAGKLLARLALQNAQDRFMTAAALSSINKKNLGPMLLVVLTGSKKYQPPTRLVESLLRMSSALGDAASLTSLLDAVSRPTNNEYQSWQYSALAGLLDALGQKNKGLEQLKLTDELRGQLAKLFAASRVIATDNKADSSERLQAIRLLGRGVGDQDKDIAILARLLIPQNPVDIQSATVASLGRLRHPKVAPVLLASWAGYGPTLRSQVLDTLLQRTDWLKTILTAIEQKKLSPSAFDAARRQRLLQHRDAGIRQRAARLFAGSLNPDRQKVLQAYQSVLALKGDSLKGAMIFKKHCSVCHKLGEVGHVVGPDLATLADKSPESLLVAVLDPNRAVESKFVNYVALTKNGQTFNGVLGAETGTSITILAQEGKKHVILRTDIDELVSTGKSTMPEGMEKEIKPPDMADLVAYLRSTGPQPKRRVFAGNKPALVRPGPKGELHLTGQNGEIYGNTIVLEKKYGNLGYWSSTDDRVVWTVEVPKGEKYAVWLDWACAKSSAGKRFLLQAGLNQFTARVESTGNWNTYRQKQFGEMVLPAGRHRLTFRSAGRIAAPLIDLKAVKLVPIGK